MPRDGSGTYTRTNGNFQGGTLWDQQAAAAPVIASDQHDTHDQDVANALTESVAKDGQTTMTGDLKMGNNKITGLGNAVVATDGLSYGQFQTEGARLAEDNTFTGANTFEGASAFESNFTVSSDDPGPAAGPFGVLDRNSASPAAGDELAKWEWRGRNSLAESHDYAELVGRITDPTDGAEDGELRMLTSVNGVVDYRLIVGDGVYTPGATGGSQGVDTINASGLFVNGVAAITTIPANSITSTELAPDAVTQTELAANAVGQGELKTSTSTVSANNGNPAHLTLGSGQYGLSYRFRTFDPSSGALTSQFSDNNSPGGSFITRIFLDPGGSSDAECQQRYITASPPFNLGDGDMAGFVFVLVDRLSKVLATYTAIVPPWAYNGPTDLRPVAWDKQGKPLRREEVHSEDLDEYADLIANAGLVPIDQDWKNRDMDLIPHPFDNLEDTTVLLLDPMRCEKLMTLHDYGESISRFLTSGKIKFDNESLNRAGPMGVRQVKFSF